MGAGGKVSCCRCSRTLIDMINGKTLSISKLRLPKDMQMYLFWFYLFFLVKLKEFYAPFVSVWKPMETKGAASKSVYLLYEPPRTNAAFTHMQCCRFKEGLCSWCCSTSNGKYVFLATNVCVVCCRTKIAGSCCTLVSHSFLHLVCKVKVVRAVWNGIFIHRLDLQRPHGKGKGAEKLILEHPRSMKHVRRHSLHRHWHSLIHSVLSSVHRIIDVRDCKR